jgi:hypothetical protein
MEATRNVGVLFDSYQRLSCAIAVACKVGRVDTRGTAFGTTKGAIGTRVGARLNWPSSSRPRHYDPTNWRVQNGAFSRTSFWTSKKANRAWNTSFGPHLVFSLVRRLPALFRRRRYESPHRQAVFRTGRAIRKTKNGRPVVNRSPVVHRKCGSCRAPPACGDGPEIRPRRP